MELWSTQFESNKNADQSWNVQRLIQCAKAYLSCLFVQTENKDSHDKCVFFLLFLFLNLNIVCLFSFCFFFWGGGGGGGLVVFVSDLRLAINTCTVLLMNA